MSTTANSLASLRRDLARRGLTAKTPNRVIMELIAHLLVSLAGVALSFCERSLPLRLLGLLISTIGSVGLATNTHTSSHYATSDRRWVNEALTYFGYPFFLCLSATYWRHKHIVIHHPAPNVIGIDCDIDLAPWFAMTDVEIERSRGWRRFYYERLQFWFFPLALAGNGFNMQRAGWVYVLSNLRRPKAGRSNHWIDLSAMLMHYMVFLFLPMFWFAVNDVLWVYVIRVILLGYAMYAVLGPGHFPEDAVCLNKSVDRADFVLLQAATAIDFRVGIIGSFICSGLQYQVEHHLFPSISHVFYPEISALIREFCERRGVPYRSFGWGEALWKSWIVLRHPHHVERHLARVPQNANPVQLDYAAD